MVEGISAEEISIAFDLRMKVQTDLETGSNLFGNQGWVCLGIGGNDKQCGQEACVFEDFGVASYRPVAQAVVVDSLLGCFAGNRPSNMIVCFFHSGQAKG